MIKYLKILAIALLLIIANTSATFGLSAPAQLKTLKISVWPEYDKTNEVLIMFRGELPSGVQLPAKVKFLYPKTARLSATSSVNENDEFQYTKEWNSKKEADKGDFTELTYNVYFRTFQFEIYDQVNTQKDKRQYGFPLKAVMDVNNLSVELQQPLRSNNFEASPKNTNTNTDDKGFKFQFYELGKIKAGEQKDFTATYTKSDNEPSTKDGAPQPVDASQSAAVNTGAVLITVGAAFAIFVLGAVVFTRKNNKVKVKPSKTHSKNSKNTGFCSQCGKPLHKDSEFCHSCGKKLA